MTKQARFQELLKELKQLGETVILVVQEAPRGDDPAPPHPPHPRPAPRTVEVGVEAAAEMIVYQADKNLVVRLATADEIAAYRAEVRG